jgi:hypothetical protein
MAENFATCLSESTHPSGSGPGRDVEDIAGPVSSHDEREALTCAVRMV